MSLYRRQRHSGNAISTAIARINLAYKEKKLYLTIIYSKVVFKLLKSLQSLGVIQTFFINIKKLQYIYYIKQRLNICVRAVDTFFKSSPSYQYSYTYEIKIYLKYVNHLPIFATIRCYWSLRRKISIPYNSLSSWNIFKSRQTFVLWTNRGILTNSECLTLGIGGLLLCGLFV